MSTTNLFNVQIRTVTFIIAFIVFCEDELSVTDMISRSFVEASSDDEGVWKATMLMNRFFLNPLAYIIFKAAKAIISVFEIGISDIIPPVGPFAV